MALIISPSIDGKPGFLKKLGYIELKQDHIGMKKWGNIIFKRDHECLQHENTCM
jgi:hypothetical protein